MNFNSYQNTTRAQRLHEPQTLDYTALRLTEEAGEVAGVVKRIARKNRDEITKGHRQRLQDEMGDLLHSLAKLANAAGLSLDDIAKQSLRKQG